ncbi:complex proteins associated with Set1p component shg1-domain-containing protein [Nemania serpens]|nr:complex proteins associated with Set1p component shg1-domain-containing protein [Nemania serpens]
MASSVVAMASVASVEQTPAPLSGITPLLPRKLKASDLPLPSATRSAIEGLAHSFKKKGGYDAIRKQVWEKFEESDYEAQVTKSILEVAEQEVERNPGQLLTLERRKAAALIDGALDRSGVYQKAEAVLDQLIDVAAIEARMRELRQTEIGAEKAEEERVRGSKTDEEYAAESTAKLAAREQLRQDIRNKEKQIQEEKLKIEREERKKRERERERELEAAETKRKEERDARRREREKKEEERQRDREKERDERRRARDRDRDHDRSPDRDARRRSRSRSRSPPRDKDRARSRRRDSRERRRHERSPRKQRDRSKTEDIKKQLTKEDHERLEQEALADLLRESNKDNSKPLEMEIDQALAPPPRRIKLASAIQPIRRDSTKTLDLKKGPEPTKSEPKDSVNDSKSNKEAMKDGHASESKVALEPREIKDTKDSKESKIKNERKSSPTPLRHHRDRSRSTAEDRSISEMGADHVINWIIESKADQGIMQETGHPKRIHTGQEIAIEADRDYEIGIVAVLAPEIAVINGPGVVQRSAVIDEIAIGIGPARLGIARRGTIEVVRSWLLTAVNPADLPGAHVAGTRIRIRIMKVRNQASMQAKRRRTKKIAVVTMLPNVSQNVETVTTIRIIGPVLDLDQQHPKGPHKRKLVKRDYPFPDWMIGGARGIAPPRPKGRVYLTRSIATDRQNAIVTVTGRGTVTVIGNLTSEETSIPNEIGRGDGTRTTTEIVIEIVITAANDAEVGAEVEVDAGTANANGAGTAIVTATGPVHIREIDTATETGIRTGTGIGTGIGAAGAKEARPVGISASAVEVPEL